MMLERKIPKRLNVIGVAAIFTLLSYFLINKTGGVMNPARYIALCIMSGNLTHLHYYFFSTIFGGIVGGLIGNMLLSESA